MRRPRPEVAGAARGFTLPLVLVLLLIVAAFSASALDEAMTNRALSTSRLAQQRAFLAAASGLNLAAATLRQDNSLPQEYPLPSPDQVQVEMRRTLRNPLPPGYSSGRFAEQFYELRSTGRSMRGARSVQVQGLRRVEPLDSAATVDTAP
jgi:type II secretory pathway pseudopilin PulG